MLLDHANFSLQEQAEDNLMVAFSWTWYNGSYTMAAKPIKSLELHYTMIQFLIIQIITFLKFVRMVQCSLPARSSMVAQGWR